MRENVLLSDYIFALFFYLLFTFLIFKLNKSDLKHTKKHAKRQHTKKHTKRYVFKMGMFFHYKSMILNLHLIDFFLLI